MNRLIFEGRFLVNLARIIICQENFHVLHGRIDWEKMYRLADYHRIANIIYLGILGNGEVVPPRWREHFFERYQKSLQYGGMCGQAEKEILMLLDMMEVPCVILSSTGIRNLYPIPETAANSPLKLYMASESYTLAKGYLVDLGYETEIIFSGSGERMTRMGGFTVEIYYDLPFKLTKYKKQMIQLVEHAYLRNSYHHVRTLSLENRYVLRMAQVVYHYVEDELIIRELLDLFLYYKAWCDQMNAEYIRKKLSDLHIDELSDKLLQVAYMWFAGKEDNRPVRQNDDMNVYDVVENRILSRGLITKETDSQAIFLANLIQKEKNREKRKDAWQSVRDKIDTHWNRFMRSLRWIFPEYKYMCIINPVLEKIPLLLPACWGKRCVRMLITVLTGGDHRKSI